MIISTARLVQTLLFDGRSYISTLQLVKCLPTLADLLSQGKTAEAGLVLSSTLYTYWEERTEREVINNI